MTTPSAVSLNDARTVKGTAGGSAQGERTRTVRSHGSKTNEIKPQALHITVCVDMYHVDLALAYQQTTKEDLACVSPTNARGGIYFHVRFGHPLLPIHPPICPSVRSRHVTFPLSFLLLDLRAPRILYYCPAYASRPSAPNTTAATPTITTRSAQGRFSPALPVIARAKGGIETRLVRGQRAATTRAGINNTPPWTMFVENDGVHRGAGIAAVGGALLAAALTAVAVSCVYSGHSVGTA